MTKQMIILISVVSTTYAVMIQRNKLQTGLTRFDVSDVKVLEEENKEEHSKANYENDFAEELFPEKNFEVYVNNRDRSKSDEHRVHTGSEIEGNQDSTKLIADKSNTDDNDSEDNKSPDEDFDMDNLDPNGQQAQKHARVKREEEEDIPLIFDDCPGKQVLKYFDGYLACAEEGDGTEISDLSDRYGGGGAFSHLGCASDRKKVRLGNRILCLNLSSGKKSTPKKKGA